jgi:hypothetical protein
MTEQDIITACRKHGAKVVSDAAYLAMQGRRTSLDALGLGLLAGLGDLHRATVIAYKLMSDDDQAADLVRATIDGAKLP